MDHQISGTGSAPNFLSTLVATSFIDCEFLVFELKATFLHDLVDRNPKALYADEIIRTLKTQFHYLKYQVLYNPYKIKKVYTEGELTGIKLFMSNMVESQKRGKTGVNGCYQDGKLPYLSVINCFRCHNKSHFQENFPLAKNSGEISKTNKIQKPLDMNIPLPGGKRYLKVEIPRLN